MSETPFEIGARATTTDDVGGQVIRIIVDPTSQAVTHVVIELDRDKRLVPVDHVHVTADGLRLNCTQADFDKLKPAGTAGWYDAGRDRYGRPFDGRLTYDSIPFGEVEVRRGDQVYATDGEIGLVDGLLIDEADHRVTHVLLQEGHLWGHKAVAIPLSAVTDLRVGVRLNLSRQQVENLPPVAVNRPGH
jgi:PRC-barrel domain